MGDNGNGGGGKDGGQNLTVTSMDPDAMREVTRRISDTTDRLGKAFNDLYGFLEDTYGSWGSPGDQTGDQFAQNYVPNYQSFMKGKNGFKPFETDLQKNVTDLKKAADQFEQQDAANAQALLNSLNQSGTSAPGGGSGSYAGNGSGGQGAQTPQPSMPPNAQGPAPQSAGAGNGSGGGPTAVGGAGASGSPTVASANPSSGSSGPVGSPSSGAVSGPGGPEAQRQQALQDVQGAARQAVQGLSGGGGGSGASGSSMTPEPSSGSSGPVGSPSSGADSGSGGPETQRQQALHDAGNAAEQAIGGLRHRPATGSAGDLASLRGYLGGHQHPAGVSPAADRVYHQAQEAIDKRIEGLAGYHGTGAYARTLHEAKAAIDRAVERLEDGARSRAVHIAQTGPDGVGRGQHGTHGSIE